MNELMIPNNIEEVKMMNHELFEGVEKRLIVKFSSDVIAATSVGSLRYIEDVKWNSLLECTGCRILSKLKINKNSNVEESPHHSSGCTAYILSESSLFVYDYSIVLKTCGTTVPLNILPELCKYLNINNFEKHINFFMFSHFNYESPEKQSYPHRTVEDEESYIKELIPSVELFRLLVGGTKSIVVFIRQNEEESTVEEMGFFEILMNDIQENCVENFVAMKEEEAVASEDPRLFKSSFASHELCNGSLMGQYYFDPCGYSCNVLRRDGKYMNVHISPEKEVLYASIETTYQVENLRHYYKSFNPKNIDLLSIQLNMKDGNYCTSKNELLFDTNQINEEYDLISRSHTEGNGYVIRHSHYRRKAVSALKYMNEIELNEYKRFHSDTQEVLPYIDGDRIRLLYLLLKRYNGDVYSSLMDGTKDVRSAFFSNEEFATGEQPLMVVDMKAVVDQWIRWKNELPDVIPHYAVKCNNNPFIVECLGILGVRFDCATKNEMQLVFDVMKKYEFFNAELIAYSHPCKLMGDLKWAAIKGVNLMVLDNVDEVHKIHLYHPNAEVLIRIRVDDKNAQCPMSTKFGASSTSWPSIFSSCKKYNLNVRGINFHVGSGCRTGGAFASALNSAKNAFELAESYGFHLDILDIGGGFPGHSPSDGFPTFEELTEEIRSSLREHFSGNSSLRVISEPGRYFASLSSTLATKIFARRTPQVEGSSKCVKSEECHEEESTSASSEETQTVIDSHVTTAASPHDMTDVVTVDTSDDNEADEKYWLYISESLYGVFNCMLYDHASVRPELLYPMHADLETAGEYYVCSAFKWDANAGKLRAKSCKNTIFGQSCDGFDWLFKCVVLPELMVGDWLMFKHIGAYSISAAAPFNGFPQPTCIYTWMMGC